MIGIIELKGVRVNKKLFPWNSRYNINNTMLFIENSWSRLNLKDFIGYKCSFKIINGEVYGSILDKSGKIIKL